MNYSKGDIVCIWVGQYYQEAYGVKPEVLLGFGKVKHQGKNFINVEWIRILNKNSRFYNSRTDKNLYQFMGDRCTLLLKNKDTNGQEDWRSLLTLAKLKHVKPNILFISKSIGPFR